MTNDLLGLGHSAPFSRRVDKTSDNTIKISLNIYTYVISFEF